MGGRPEIHACTQDALSVRGISKSFGGTHALVGVDVVARAGEVVAILGENGAGKSTLMQLLAGAITPDAGEMLLGNQPFAPSDPAAARHWGIALVPQEPELATHLSVAENVMLGCEPVRRGFVDWQCLRRRANDCLQQVAGQSRPLDGRRSARDLSASERQRVTIARALAQPKLRVLIFDEPTSSLTAEDVEQLFSIIARLKQRGIVILYVSHFLEEVMRVADRYCVLRDGHLVAAGQIQHTTAAELVSAMAGGAVQQHVRQVKRQRGPVVLEVRGLRGDPLPVEASFDLHAGEILGIAGLVGAGRSELVRTLFGLERVKAGQVRLKSVELRPDAARSLARGLGLLSEDRRSEGLAQRLPIAQNVTMSRWTGFGPLTTERCEQHKSGPLIEQLGIRCRGPEQPVWELSGGNQQKVALARLLYHDVDVLLLDEPTRGIDVRSRIDVHRMIDGLAARGKAILLISSYLPELLALSDRVAVMCRGRMSEAKPVTDLNEHTLLMQATGLI